MQANFMIDLGNKSQVPIISFSATSPFLSSLRSQYFFRATQNDSSQVKAISAIVQAFGWREVVPIYVDNEFGEGVIPYLSDALEEVNARIPYRSVISPEAIDEEIRRELYKLMSMQCRVFIVHMVPDLGLRVFDIAKEIGMMDEEYVWIITDGMTNLWSMIDRSDMDSMQGVLGVRIYIPESKEFDTFKVRWKREFVQNNPSMVNAELDIFGLWAYDAIFALAMAVEKLGTENFSFDASRVSESARTDLESFGVSEIGPKLIKALSSTRFKGLSGEFGFINGQLESPIFQIVNVNGNGERRIGFWTLKYGLVKRLNFTNVTGYSTSKANLGTIIWPGDTHSTPKGWEIPTKGKRLKIGVPVKTGFSEFVKLPPCTGPNSTVVPTGYCIDVFNAVMEAMPYGVPFDFYAFENADQEMAGTYNDLIDQVVYGKYDAVVGDISIIANRSFYVDFTLPFTESGVVMVVPIRDGSNKNAWAFLKPLTWDLWVTSGCFFVFIGFVIWILEHRINEDFRGPPLHHVGTSFWFSFSTMVFAHRERVVSNPARFVVLIWCFVVLILTQSYTASLASLLTVQQLQPTVTDVNELLRRRENVGYHNGSFVKGIVRRLKFDPSKMKTFNSPEELDELFTNGSANGGIAAAFDEIPYMKLFLEKYCNKYTSVEPTFKTDGFGFVFPKGSRLVSDVSRAILTIMEGEKMKEIENKWFPKQTNCPNSSTSISSNSLSLGSFWGLFLIAGVAAVLALIISAGEFLYMQRDVLCIPGISVWRRILQVLRNFDKKDLTSHTFRQSDLKERSCLDSVQIIGAIEVSVEASPNTNCPPSPSNSDPIDLSLTFFGEQGSPSTDNNLGSTTSPEIEI
ncbi:hypothetical protein SLEP1_g15448 [Rubroshorea leprosula]|uniref:Glutamate receptor n=1 Tax=Rubroshorea leprosula TaxID=152421 RepID=A0AAV5IWT4_9ROSI|nr:hypothetical protein SLEP1_g15448 [Rubroshorea leprosula]